MCGVTTCKSLAIAGLLAALACAPLEATEYLLRVTCKGNYQMSSEHQKLQCAEADSFVDADGTLQTPSSTASANLRTQHLVAEVAGSSIRHVSYQGRTASALIADALTLSGSWTGKLPVTFDLRIDYRFDGFGESQLLAALRSSRTLPPYKRKLAAIQLRNTGLGGTRLFVDGNEGNVVVPQSGYYPVAATIDVSITELLEASATIVRLRTDLTAHSLPNLSNLDPTISSILVSRARLLLSAPCLVEVATSSGTLPIKLVVSTAAPKPEESWSCGPEG